MFVFDFIRKRVSWINTQAELWEEMDLIASSRDRLANELERAEAAEKAARAFVEHIEAIDLLSLEQRLEQFPPWRQTSHKLYDALKKAVEQR